MGFLRQAGTLSVQALCRTLAPGSSLLPKGTALRRHPIHLRARIKPRWTRAIWYAALEDGHCDPEEFPITP